MCLSVHEKKFKKIINNFISLKKGKKIVCFFIKNKKKR